MTTTVPELASPKVTKLMNETNALVTNYEGFLVQNDVEYRDAAEDLKVIKQQQAKVEEERFAITRPMDAAKKAVMDFFRPFADRLEESERHVKKAMGDYHQEQERIAQEAARIERERAEKEAKRLREEAEEADRKAAEKERKRLAEEQRKADERAAAERERIAEEQRIAKEADDKEAQRRADEQAEAQRQREEREQEELHQKRLAQEKEERERTARAETLEQRAETVTTAPVVSAPKVKGVSTRKKWCFEIVDASKVPDEYKVIDEKRIGGVVRALKDNANIPGVRVYTEAVVSARK